MFASLPLLSLLIVVPIIGAIMVLIFTHQPRILKSVAVLTTAACLGLCVPLVMNFDLGTALMQYQEYHEWIPAYGIHYALGIDGISLVMIVLATFTGFVVVLSGCANIKPNQAQYMATFLLMQAMLVGVFAARDAALFYVFWEGMLIPMYLNIGMWGSEARLSAAIKFFLYMFFGSIIMLVALLYLANQAGSWSIDAFYQLHLSAAQQYWLFFAFFIAFAVKAPMLPLHTWLPDVHTAAPSGGSVVLAALMLKLGVYLILRLSLPIVPVACHDFAWVMVLLSLLAIIYIGLIAWVQEDMKCLIAYSSIAHMGIATLGCFLPYSLVSNGLNIDSAIMSLSGAVFQMVGHAFSSGGLFLGLGWLADRHHRHSRSLADYSGIAAKMPVFACCFMLFALSNLGLPGTAGFVGEFLVIASAIKSHILVAAAAAVTLILAAMYTLRLCQLLLFGPAMPKDSGNFTDLSKLELLNYFILAAGVVLLGLYPNYIVHLLQPSLARLLVASMPYGLAL